MFLVVDSGSSKSDWFLMDNNGHKKASFSTKGYNPLIVDNAFVYDDLMLHSDLRQIAEHITHIYFFGAGCTSLELNDTVFKALKRVFVKADIMVDHDLLACAYASYQGSPIICAILGTGSNSCFFDGLQITQGVPALGHILGDEGSGSFFGKILLRSFLYKQLDPALNKAFLDEFALDKLTIFDNLYKSHTPNTYMASFMPFIYKYRHHKQIQGWLAYGFDEFIKIHLLNYPNNKVKFIGSIGHFFGDELKEVCVKNNLEFIACIQKPIDNLSVYMYQHFYKKKS